MPYIRHIRDDPPFDIKKGTITEVDQIARDDIGEEFVRVGSPELICMALGLNGKRFWEEITPLELLALEAE